MKRYDIIALLSITTLTAACADEGPTPAETGKNGAGGDTSVSSGIGGEDPGFPGGPTPFDVACLEACEALEEAAADQSCSLQTSTTCFALCELEAPSAEAAYADVCLGMSSVMVQEMEACLASGLECVDLASCDEIVFQTVDACAEAESGGGANRCDFDCNRCDEGPVRQQCQTTADQCADLDDATAREACCGQLNNQFELACP